MASSKKIDLSQYSDEELQKFASGDYQYSAEPEHGALYNLASGTGSFLKGAGMGAGQAIGDTAASVLNAPIQGAEWLSGHNLPHVPHPNLINENPESSSENVGQMIGQLLGSVAAPGGVGFKAAQLAGKGYKAYTGAKELGLLGKLGAGALGGAVEGGLTNEENRTGGAAAGALFGASGHAIPATAKYFQSATTKDIGKQISKQISGFKDLAEEKFTEALTKGTQSGANKFLKPQKANIDIFKKAGTSGIIRKGEKGKRLEYALEEYNKNPTLEKAHAAQRDMNKLVTKYEGAAPGTVEAAAYKQALQVKNQLLAKISNAFEKSGAQDAGKLYSHSRQSYAKYLGPYLDSPAIRAFEAGKINDKQLVDTLMKEHSAFKPGESFITKKGSKVPGLERREKIKKYAPHIIGPAKVAGGIGLASLGLPYAIQKILGTE